MSLSGTIFSPVAIKVLLNSARWTLYSSLFNVQMPESRENSVFFSPTKTESHVHREILVVLSGECECRLNSNIYLAKPGDVFLFDTYEKHNSGYASGVQGIEHLWLLWLGNNIVARIERRPRAGKVRQEVIFENSFLIDLLDSTWDRLKRRKDYPETLKKELLKSALSVITAKIVEQDMYREQKLETPAEYRKKIINTMRQYIDSTAGKGLSIERLANAAGYSKSHFIRLFQEQSGQSVHQYINYVRMQKVHQLEKQGFLKKEISETLGFSCPAAFSNWFRKNMKK